MLKIGEKIKELRKSQDVTQEKLADYLNISYQAVSKWENGLAMPDITLIPALTCFFGVSADYLIGIDTEQSDKVIEKCTRQSIAFEAYRKGKRRHRINRKNASVISKQS